MSRTRTFWIIAAICLLGVAIRSYNITTRSLWFDEAFSWRLVSFSFSEMIARDAADVHPPLYYILLKSWAYVFGTSLLALRMFSVACAGISIVAGYFYTSYAFHSKRAGVYAAMLLALSPWVISYAWEARMYPLGMIFAFLSSHALLKAVREKSFAWSVVYALYATALIYTHYFGFFTVIAQALFVGGVLVHATKWRVGEIVQSRVFWSSILAVCLSLALFSPWIPTFLRQRSQVQEAYWVPPIAATSVPDTFYHFFVPTLHIPPHRGLILVVSLLPILGTIALWTYILMRYKKLDAAWLSVMLTVVPFAVAVAVSFMGRSLYNDRFFGFSGIFIFVLLAHAIASLKRPLARNIVFAVFILGFAASFARYWNELDIANKAGAHGAAQRIFSERADSDPVLVSSPFVYFSILHYATEEFGAPQVPRFYSPSGELSHFSGGPIMVAEDVVGNSEIATYKGTVWVVDTTGFSESPFAQPRHWREVSREVFPEVFAHQGDIIVRKFAVSHL